MQSAKVPNPPPPASVFGQSSAQHTQKTHIHSTEKIPALPTELWVQILGNLPLQELWIHARLCCLLFNAISMEIAHRIIRTRINNLCSVHSGNQLSLTTPHFHWNLPDNTPTYLTYMTWSSLPEDQHPDIFLAPSNEIPCCFSLYLAAEMSWTYTIRVIFHLCERANDGVELWVADSYGAGWEMYYGTQKGPLREDIPADLALRLHRVCPTRVVLPLSGLVRMLFLGPDQGY